MIAQLLRDEDQVAIFKIGLADFLIEWNHLEKLTSLFLFKLAGGDNKIAVLTARLQASSLTQALVPLSHLHPDPFRTHIQTFAKRFDRLRAWRNLYIHGFFAVGFSDGQGGGLIQGAGIKGGKLAMTDVLVTYAEIKSALEWIKSLRDYLNSFILELWDGVPSPVNWEDVKAPPPAPDLPKASDSPFLKLRDD